MSPVRIRKLKGRNRYRVSTPSGVKSRRTTKRKAESQARLLRAVDHGWKPSRVKRHRVKRKK